jgi:hypothetical protein
MRILYGPVPEGAVPFGRNGQAGQDGGSGQNGGRDGSAGGNAQNGQGGPGNQGNQGSPGGQGNVPGNAPGGAPGGRNGFPGGQGGQGGQGSQGGQGAPAMPGGDGTGNGGPGRMLAGPGGGGGGLLNGSSAGKEVTAKLKQDADKYRWVAAAVGSNNASGYQLATGKPVMALGGFNGSDPSLDLDGFRKLVAAGKIHYFIGGGDFGGSMGGSSYSQEIASWVQANFTAQTVDGTTLYDLTQPNG